MSDYVPRTEPANWMAGGKVVNVAKVKWVTMPDIQTAANALMSGEIDYIEQMQVDLLPVLEGDDAVKVEVREPTGMQTMVRMNFLHPPFDNPKVRTAALQAISQEPVLAASTMAAGSAIAKSCHPNQPYRYSPSATPSQRLASTTATASARIGVSSGTGAE